MKNHLFLFIVSISVLVLSCKKNNSTSKTYTNTYVSINYDGPPYSGSAFNTLLTVKVNNSIADTFTLNIDGGSGTLGINDIGTLKSGDVVTITFSNGIISNGPTVPSYDNTTSLDNVGLSSPFFHYNSIEFFTDDISDIGFLSKVFTNMEAKGQKTAANTTYSVTIL